ncbi:hypothetical protein I7I48_03430 [Histoplasma ohiense]|nr:hypothetical protein I7I48_03430 [Histoplasma ohiense (nom. inval.)]
MAAVAERAMSSTELYMKFSNPRTSINVAHIRPVDVHPIYESEEEEMSEAEATGQPEPGFSPIENDSDTGVSEFEEINVNPSQAHVAHESYTSGHKFALQISPFPTPEGTISRAASISTVKRASCITLMPQIHPQPTKLVSPVTPTSESNSPSNSPPFLPFIEGKPLSKPVTEEDTLQNLRSFYSDTVSSDDDDLANTSFLIATPVSLYAPERKPHLISIESPTAQISNGRITETQKIQELVPLASGGSSKRSPGRNLKKRISGLNIGKYTQRRSSNQPASESTFPTKPLFSNASVHSLSSLSWRSSSALSSNSEAELHSSVTSRESPGVTSPPQRSHTLLPSPRMLEQKSPDGSCKTNERHVADNVKRRENANRTSYRRTSKIKMNHNIPPVPQIMGIAISSDMSSPASVESSLDSPRPSTLPDRRLPPSPICPTYTASRRNSKSTKSSLSSSPAPVTPMERSTHFPFPDIPSSGTLQVASKRRGFHERTHSINSLTSTTSMPNFASSDNPSPRSATHRYRQRFYPADNTPSERSPSRESVNQVKLNPRNTYTFAPRGSIPTMNLSNLSSSSTATSRSNSQTDVNNLSWNYRTGAWSPSTTPAVDSLKVPLRKQAHSKSIKRLYETSESVSRAGTKAFNGLGSILRKKNVASSDERWSSNRVV